MLYRLLGHVVRRAWPLLLAGWALLVVATRLAAPPWDEVAQDREFAFLPQDAPSRRADEVLEKAFPDDRLASNIVLVLRRSENQRGALDRERKFIEDVLEPALRKIAEDEGGLASQPAPLDEPLFPGEDNPRHESQKPEQRSIIVRIRTPNAPGRGALLVSPDRQALLIVVELTTEFLANRNWSTISRIENLVRDLREQGKLPPGVDISVTGSAVIGRDHTQAQLQSAHATEVLTVVLVVVLLVLIYRAPLPALIPLATVYLAVQVSVSILAILARAGHLTLFQGIQIYITILAYGAGVDYSLFLTARYKEELDRGVTPADAVARAVGGVGSALAASAATVMCGIGMMVFAEFGKFREAGIAIPLSLGLVLLATLTFSPSLLRLVGRWAFWPQRRPLAPPEEDSSRGARGLPWAWERVGELLLRRPGAVWLITAALMAPFVVVGGVFHNRLSYDLIGSLPADAPSVAGTRVLQEHFPAGMVGPVTVLLVNPHVDFRSPEGQALVRRVTDQLREQREELGLADIRTLTAPLGITKAAERSLAHLDVPEEARKEGTKRAALERYVTDLGGRAKVGTRLDLILEQSPFSHFSVDDLDRIERAVREALPAELREDSALYCAGTTASVRDLAAVMQRDRTRIELLVLASVFVILILLLHRFVVPLYLLLSVLFSYYATLGVSFAVFWMLDPHGFAGIDWKVAIFLFTILIAVGEDYNIFLMARVHEEEHVYGPVRGVTQALDRTGPIISSCGIIMAGTFASLLAGSLTEMKQLGFALAFGVLLDTFVVRPILVPAFLILGRSGRLAPARWTGKAPQARAQAPRPQQQAPTP
ncbi:MAG: MMPL family transporter [Planctomycetes bacterium]|nr:MMPL family transporter [Planctomycetota bacterium]